MVGVLKAKEVAAEDFDVARAVGVELTVGVDQNGRVEAGIC